MTYTLLAVDPAAKLVGAVTASRYFGVGGSVLAIAPDAGAVASQAWSNRRLRARGVEALRAGRSPLEIAESLPDWDAEASLRQFAVIDLAGSSAHATGADCQPWAGGLSAPDAVAIGNLIAGPQVLEAMLGSFASTARHAVPMAEDPEAAVRVFSERLLEALAAGERAGGDIRGREAAGIQVAHFSDVVEYPADLAVDLRIDHHRNPLRQLERLLDVRFTPRNDDDDVHARRPRMRRRTARATRPAIDDLRVEEQPAP